MGNWVKKKRLSKCPEYVDVNRYFSTILETLKNGWFLDNYFESEEEFKESLEREGEWYQLEMYEDEVGLMVMFKDWLYIFDVAGRITSIGELERLACDCNGEHDWERVFIGTSFNGRNMVREVCKGCGISGDVYVDGDGGLVE